MPTIVAMKAVFMMASFQINIKTSVRSGQDEGAGVGSGRRRIVGAQAADRSRCDDLAGFNQKNNMGQH